jgi:hypothetical protein
MRTHRSLCHVEPSSIRADAADARRQLAPPAAAAAAAAAAGGGGGGGGDDDDDDDDGDRLHQGIDTLKARA